VVSKDLYRQISPFEIRTPFLKAANDGQELFVVDLVITLSGSHLPGEEGHWVQYTIIVLLGQDTSCDIV
jgi:hypothetical protein